MDSIGRHRRPWTSYHCSIAAVGLQAISIATTIPSSRRGHDQAWYGEAGAGPSCFMASMEAITRRASWGKVGLGRCAGVELCDKG